MRWTVESPMWGVRRWTCRSLDREWEKREGESGWSAGGSGSDGTVGWERALATGIERLNHHVVEVVFSILFFHYVGTRFSFRVEVGLPIFFTWGGGIAGRSNHERG